VVVVVVVVVLDSILCVSRWIPPAPRSCSMSLHVDGAVLLHVCTQCCVHLSVFFSSSISIILDAYFFLDLICDRLAVDLSLQLTVTMGGSDSGGRAGRPATGRWPGSIPGSFLA